MTSSEISIEKQAPASQAPAPTAALLRTRGAGCAQDGHAGGVSGRVARTWRTAGREARLRGRAGGAAVWCDPDCLGECYRLQAEKMQIYARCGPEAGARCERARVAVAPPPLDARMWRVVEQRCLDSSWQGGGLHELTEPRVRALDDSAPARRCSRPRARLRQSKSSGRICDAHRVLGKGKALPASRAHRARSHPAFGGPPHHLLSRSSSRQCLPAPLSETRAPPPRPSSRCVLLLSTSPSPRRPRRCCTPAPSLDYQLGVCDATTLGGEPEGVPAHLHLPVAPQARPVHADKLRLAQALHAPRACSAHRLRRGGTATTALRRGAWCDATRLLPDVRGDRARRTPALGASGGAQRSTTSEPPTSTPLVDFQRMLRPCGCTRRSRTILLHYCSRPRARGCCIVAARVYRLGAPRPRRRRLLVRASSRARVTAFVGFVVTAARRRHRRSAVSGASYPRSCISLWHASDGRCRARTAWRRRGARPGSCPLR